MDSKDVGKHNEELAESIRRLSKGKGYRDQSGLIICPTRGTIATRVVGSWFSLLKPMNQMWAGPFFIEGMEVGEAYNNFFTSLADGNMGNIKYVLTIEEDNIPPPDGLLRLLETMEEGKWGAVGGLYWTKGVEGQPMIYGDTTVQPLNFRPQPPQLDKVVPCNGLGMGFTLFNTAIFKDKKKAIERPFFLTQQQYEPHKGISCFTQDLYFFNKAAQAGVKVACDCRVKVGHYDINTKEVW